MSIRPIVCALAIFYFPVAASAQTFLPSEIVNWHSRSFSGDSDYRYKKAPTGSPYLEASCKSGNASALLHEQEISISKETTLEWTWRLPEPATNNQDERSKSGDDFNARIYVVVKRGFLNLATRAINYVWSSKEPMGSSWENPFSDQAIMLSVADRDAPVQQWQTIHRYIKADFKRYHGIDVDKIDGIAVMVDCDNEHTPRAFHLRQIKIIR
ncbi:DUF3047 domain-containing protein [Idiomarina loihiensis]|uniref:DUF3047 domain-containing protein n=1 Tax=Idiomarina loihiensis TaxID=135577 RepID=UPI0031586F73